jgi:catechol 2,3-dioxygenase-like lactoylglutathione lyase family enzyme
MPIIAIDHVQLAMPAGGEAQARKFYAGLLGMTEVPKPADRVARGGAWFEIGAVKLHLGVEGDFRPARKAHPGLVVRDLPALAQVLRDAGVAVLAEERPAERRIYVDDPFGNRIELLEPLP